MHKRKGTLLKSGLLALTLLFNKSVFANDLDMTENPWQCDDIGVLNIRPCPDNDAKFCGYMQNITPQAAKKFHLKEDAVAHTSEIQVARNLEWSWKKNRYIRGKVMNSKDFFIRQAIVSLKFLGKDKKRVKVSGYLGPFGHSFKCNKM